MFEAEKDMILHSRSRAALVLVASLLTACGNARTQIVEPGGLQLTIQKATVNSNRQVEVTYRLTDRNGVAHGLGGVTNNWTLASLSNDAIGVPMWVAYVKSGQALPTGEKQPGAETDSGVSQGADGTFRYIYKTQLPDGYDPKATYRVGVYSRLQTGTDASGAAIYDPDQPNAVFDFVPAGGTPQTRELVNDKACGTCHVQVQAHGGFRRGVQICSTCHTTQLLDPDTTDPAKLEPANPLDLGRLVHRIHRGRQLQTVQNVLNAAAGCPTPTSTVGCPSTPPPLAAREATIAAGEAAGVARYHVIGFGGSDNVFGAAAVRTENGISTVYASGVNLPPPNDVRNCAVCHAPDAKDSSQHLTTVERRICTACHADVWFNNGTVPDAYHILHTTNIGPLTLPFINDNSCAGCHSQTNAPPVDAAHPLSSLEFGRYVGYAHTVPIKSQQLAGLKADIVSFTNAGPGQTPTLVFKLSDSTGPVTNGTTNPISVFSPCGTGSVRATVNGPTTPDYQFFPNYFQEELVFTRVGNTCTPDRATYDPATGNWTHVFTQAIPASATGTWGMGIEARRSVTLKNPDEPDPNATFTVTEGAFNPITYFAVTGGTPTPRKIAVAQDKCNACHLALQFHGNQRDSVEYCVLCHTPDNTDWGRRPKTGTGASAVVNVAATVDAKEERSIHFKAMIHRIHMGSGLELQKPYVIYGFGGSVNFFDEGGLPDTSRPHCELCHEGDAYKLEAMPPDRLPTISNESATTVHVGTNAPVPGESSIPPMTAACISCHDTQTAVAHAQSFAPPVAPAERCLECHGDRGVRAVSRVHPVSGTTTQ